MKLSLVLCGLLLLVVTVSCSPVAKREAVDDLNPLNENDDDERSDRDKRKIGVIKLGVGNGIINFVFGKLDAFLEAKTKALSVLDESNKAKNAVFDIDNTKSATSEFIGKFLAQKAKASSASIGPLVNAGTTFLSSAKQGLTGAFISKFAPLSSLSSGLASGLSGGSGGGAHDDSSNGGGYGAGGGAGGSNSGSFLTGILGSLSSSSSGNGGGIGGLGSLSNSGLSGPDGGESAGNGVDELDTDFPTVTADSNANAGFGNLGGGKKPPATLKPKTRKIIRTTTEAIPEFDRKKVSLEIPPQLIGTSYTVVSNISQIIGSIVMNSAKRTATILELFKPLFRGIFAIKGLPSDSPNKL